MTNTTPITGRTPDGCPGLEAVGVGHRSPGRHWGLPLLIALPFFDSGLMLSLIQPPLGWSFFAWVAMVSFALGCTPAFRPRSIALAAFVVGFLYWLVNLHWIAPITAPGWIGLCLYVALLWPLLALALRFCRVRNIPLTLALPILVVGAERLQGFPLGGFYWRLLGHSQYANITLIQIADIFGAGGISFVVALVNGLVADVILAVAALRPSSEDATPVLAGQAQGPAPTSDAVSIFESYFAGPTCSGVSLALRTGLVVAVLAGTALYGRWRIGQSDEYISEGPRVAALQSNVPQSVKNSYQASDELFAELLAQSESAAAAGAELIAWPETMVQGILQPEIWPALRDFPEDYKTFYDTLARHARNTAYLLVGAYGAKILTDPEGRRYLGNYNSAFFFRTDGTCDPNHYSKIHLVLFGEYIPFRRSFHWLYEQLKRFTPKEYQNDYSLEHGTDYTVFEMTTPIGPTEPNAPAPPKTTYRFGTIICYEDAIPYVARNFSLDENRNKRVNWLVNISNDGWFVQFRDKPPHVKPSSELAQHAAICVFRAIENRLPILRSVNTGISCLIDSTGQMRAGYVASSEGFPTDAMHRTGMAGWFLDRMPIDSRVTFYSRHGQWLDTICATVFVALLAGPAVVSISRKRRAHRSREKSIA